MAAFCLSMLSLPPVCPVQGSQNSIVINKQTVKDDILCTRSVSRDRIRLRHCSNKDESESDLAGLTWHHVYSRVTRRLSFTLLCTGDVTLTVCETMTRQFFFFFFRSGARATSLLTLEVMSWGQEGCRVGEQFDVCVKRAERQGCKWKTATTATCLQSPLKAPVVIFSALALEKRATATASQWLQLRGEVTPRVLLVFHLRLKRASLFCSFLLGLFVLRAKMHDVQASYQYGVRLLTAIDWPDHCRPTAFASKGGFYNKEAKTDLLAFGLHTPTTLHQTHQATTL